VSIDLTKLRNIGIAAHIDAGKTSTTEGMLYFSGRTHKMGLVDDGTTVTDFDQEEQERGITIYSAAVSFPWQDHVICLIDTPGHVDFTAEVERALRVLDGMIAVFDAKEGVEAQSETVWHQADHYRVPRICLINKMDKVGADFGASFESIRQQLGAQPAAVQIPIGAENFFEGLIDLVVMQAVYYTEGRQGTAGRIAPIPAELEQAARRARHRLEEQVAETNETLMEKYINDEPLTNEELKAGLRAATIANKLQPVFCGSALQRVGIHRLMDGVVDYLPSPLNLPPVTGTRLVPTATRAQRRAAKTVSDEKVECPCDPAAPLVAYVFKVVADKPMDLYFVRVYSGVLKAGSRVFNAGRGCKENISRMFRIFAKRREQVDQAQAGEIVAVLGLKESLTGDTLCDARHPIMLERIEFPETVISMSIEPESSADRDKLLEALAMLTRENPTFQYRVNEETGQTLISGMGELHLEVLINRLRRAWNVRVRVGKPRVSYRETVGATGEATEEFNRQIGGRTHYARVKLRVEPFEPGESQEHVLFVNEVRGDVLPAPLVAAVEEGVRDTAGTGVLAGNPMMNVKVTLLEADVHEEDSSELAFDAAARRAFDRAAEAARPALMEPIMRVQVVAPEAYFGGVSSDLSRRRGVVTDSRLRGDRRVIEALVPLREMLGYATELRSLTQGRGGWSMEPSHYAVVPADVAASILSLV